VGSPTIPILQLRSDFAPKPVRGGLSHPIFLKNIYIFNRFCFKIFIFVRYIDTYQIFKGVNMDFCQILYES
jgi:hypothetical protein